MASPDCSLRISRHSSSASSTRPASHSVCVSQTRAMRFGRISGGAAPPRDDDASKDPWGTGEILSASAARKSFLRRRKRITYIVTAVSLENGVHAVGEDGHHGPQILA